MRRAILPYLAVIAFLAPPCAAQVATTSRPAATTRPSAVAFPGVPLRLVPPSPSIVTDLSGDPNVVLGTFPLATARPPVVDGDTIRVDGLKSSLRLVGIDTEETFKDEGRRKLAATDWQEYLKTMYAGTRAGRPPKFGTPFGEAGRDFAERFFAGLKMVRLELDDPARKLGYYGRHLVHVLAPKDGRWVDFNVEVVRQGLSPYFIKYGHSERYHLAFLEAEKEARDAGRGIWAEQAAYPCYPDYPTRLRWWQERDQDLQAVRILRKGAKDLFVLGEDEDWQALGRAEGRVLTVAGVPGRLIRKGKIGLFPLAHRNKSDFLIVGSPEAVLALGLQQHEGDLMLVSGRVSLHRGRPQMLAEDVTAVRPVPRG